MVQSALATSIANVASPTPAQVFRASSQQLQWIVLGQLQAITTLTVSEGQLGDINHRLEAHQLRPQGPFSAFEDQQMLSIHTRKPAEKWESSSVDLL